MTDLITKAQGIGYFNNHIQRIPETKKKENIEKTFEKIREKISDVKETDSRAINEYNLNGHSREDYDSEKHLDISA